MFLFRRKKENAENTADGLNLEEIVKLEKSISPAKPVKPAGKDKKEKAVKKAEGGTTAKDPFFQAEDALQIIENDTPVKVVIPASSLIEEEESEPLKAGAPEPVGEPVAEEVVDSLFEKVNEGKEEEEEEVSLEGILPPIDKKMAARLAGKEPAAAADKAPAVAQPQSPAAAKSNGAAEGQVQSPEAAKSPAPAEGKTESAKADKSPAPAEGKTEGAAAAKLPGAAEAKLPGAAEAKPPAPAAEAAKKGGAEENGNLFSQLFGKTEEVEETAVDRLIKSLPEISIEEVLNEAEEVKGLMSEWYQNQAK
jgi:hypothetical protein